MSSNDSAASDWVVGSKRKPVELLSSDESESESESDTACGSALKRSRIREGSHGTIVSPIATIDIDENCHDVAVALSASSLRARVSEFDLEASEVQRNPVSNTPVNIANKTVTATTAPTSSTALASSFPVADSRAQSHSSVGKVVLVSRLSAIRSCTPYTAYLGQAKMHGFDFHVYPYTNMQDVTRRFGYSYTTIVSADHPDLCYIPTTGDVNSVHNVRCGSSSGLTDVDTASVASDTSESDTTSMLTTAAASVFTVPLGINTEATTSTNTTTTNTSITSTSANYITTTDTTCNSRNRTTTSSNTTSKTRTSTTFNTPSNTPSNTTSNTTSLSRRVVLVSPECGVKESSPDISTSSLGCLGRARMGKYEYLVFRYTNMRDINHRFGLGCTSIVGIDDPYLRFIEEDEPMQSVDANMYDNTVSSDCVYAMQKYERGGKTPKRVRFETTTSSLTTASSTASTTPLTPPDVVSDTASASASGTTTGSTTTSSDGSNSDNADSNSTTAILPTTTTTTTHINIHQVQQYFTELNTMDDNTLRSRRIDPIAFRALVSAQVKLAEAVEDMLSWK